MLCVLLFMLAGKSQQFTAADCAAPCCRDRKASNMVGRSIVLLGRTPLPGLAWMQASMASVKLAATPVTKCVEARSWAIAHTTRAAENKRAEQKDQECAGSGLNELAADHRHQKEHQVPHCCELSPARDR